MNPRELWLCQSLPVSPSPLTHPALSRGLDDFFALLPGLGVCDFLLQFPALGGHKQKAGKWESSCADKAAH